MTRYLVTERANNIKVTMRPSLSLVCRISLNLSNHSEETTKTINNILVFTAILIYHLKFIKETSLETYSLHCLMISLHRMECNLPST